MSTLENRLAVVARGLTAKQRALLTFRAHGRDEQPDPLVSRQIPFEQQAAYQQQLSRLYDVNEIAGSAIGLAQHWTIETERTLHALSWMLTLRRRIDELSDGVRALGGRVSERRRGSNAVRVTPYPSAFPWTVGEGIDPLYGRLEADHWDEHPPDLEQLLEALRHSVGRTLGARSLDAAGWEHALTEVGRREFDGEEIVHPLLQRALLDLRKKLQDLAERAEPLGVVVDFAEPTEEWLNAALIQLGDGRP